MPGRANKCELNREKYENMRAMRSVESRTKVPANTELIHFGQSCSASAEIARPKRKCERSLAEQAQQPVGKSWCSALALTLHSSEGAGNNLPSTKRTTCLTVTLKRANIQAA